MSNTEIKTDHELSEGETISIRTPEGLIYISTFAGTGISIYDANDQEPVSMVFLRGDKP